MPELSHAPLHSRMISLRVEWAADGDIAVDGRIFDLRKRGLVPLLGKLQGPGVVHDMSVSLLLDGTDLTLKAIEPVMSAYPFAPRQRTQNEGCPDILPRVQGLVGQRLNDDYDAELVAQIGGPRGCFHVFTMMRLLGPSVVAAVERERERRRKRRTATASEEAPAKGSPIHARSVIIDGELGEGMRLVLRGMLFDLDYVPEAETRPLEEEMAQSVEVNADLEIEVPGMKIVGSQVNVRRTEHDIDAPGKWQADALAPQLVGHTIYKGYTARVKGIYAGAEDVDEILHLLFMAAPTMIQCMPSLMDQVEWRPRRAEGSRGAVDSCHMWRADGPLMIG